MIIPPNPQQRAGNNVSETARALLQVLEAAPVSEADKLAILGAVAGTRGGMIVKFHLHQQPNHETCNACRAVRWANIGERCQTHLE